jgi:oxalate decarboxylase/phosphoglucose isomerase-like protein (cupin superfamily)
VQKRFRGVVPVSRIGRVLYKEQCFLSKSGGELHVILQLDQALFMIFFGHKKVMRIYRVTNIPKGGVGAGEFHKLRSEIIIVEKGSFKLLLEDVLGNRREVKLRERTAFGIIPPYTLHTYISLSKDACLNVIANTLYERKKPRTHDTYSTTEFRRLQFLASS